MDVRRRDLGIAAGADRPDRVVFGDRRSLRDGDRAEVGERDGVAVGSEDGHALAGGRNRPGEGHGTTLRRNNGGALVTGDVDATVLSGGIRMRRIEGIRLNDDAGSGPGPRTRPRDEEQR